MSLFTIALHLYPCKQIFKKTFLFIFFARPVKSLISPPLAGGDKGEGEVLNPINLFRLFRILVSASLHPPHSNSDPARYSYCPARVSVSL